MLSFKVTLAQSQTEAWTRLTIENLKLIPKTNLSVESQFRRQYQTRFVSSNSNTYSIRIWIRGNIQRSQNWFYLSSPIAFFHRDPIKSGKGLATNEWRLTQLFGYQMTEAPFQFRTGIEFRAFNNELLNWTEFRIRSRIQTELRKGKLISPISSLEHFARINDAKWSFDQFRLLAGVKIDWLIQPEIGYQYHFRKSNKENIESQIAYIYLKPQLKNGNTRK